MRYYLLLFAFLLSIPSIYAQKGKALFDNTTLHEIHLSFPEQAFWDTLTNRYWANRGFSGSDIVYTPATMVVNGVQLDTIGVRFRGKSTFSRSNEFKKPFKIDINEYDTLQTYDGLKKFNLHNGSCDPSMLRDFLSYDLLRKMGLKVPRVAHCQLFINGEYWGLYTIIEQIDKTFLENNFSNGNGNLYKNNRISELLWKGFDPEIYKKDFEKKTNKAADDWSDFVEFIRVLNTEADNVFKEKIERVFNVDSYLKAMAVDVTLNNWDSYLHGSRNWYLYHNPDTGLFEWIPWDYNLAMGGDFTYVGNPYRPLQEDCDLIADFAYYQVDGQYVFVEQSNQATTSWEWDFGNGDKANNQNPTYNFADLEETTVCLTTKIASEEKTCTHTRCKKLNLVGGLDDCIRDSSNTNIPENIDTIFQQVISINPYCCQVGWDATCDLQYDNLKNGLPPLTFNTDIDYNVNLPLFIQNNHKVLINRLLRVYEFQKRYLEYVCIIMEHHFTKERIAPIIQQQSDLIRTAIYEDPNYIYSRDWFEYDVGNGSGGAWPTEIPALNLFIDNRRTQMDNAIAYYSIDCSPALETIDWQAIVINEFIASNQDSIGGIPDANGEFDDWLELYNNTDETIDLSDYYLSDNFEQPQKWKFPDSTKIEPNDYLIIWADKDHAQTGMHASFKLSASGEYLMLSHETGTVIDSFSYGPQITNVASARLPNGTGQFEFHPTSFDQNNELVSSIAPSGLKTPTINIYPNPANDYLFIETEGLNMPSTILLRNLYGEVVLTKTFNNQLKIELAQNRLSAGIYFVEVSIDNQQFIKKVVIKN